MIPYVLDSRKTKRRINVWSAAASSEQENYSLAILVKELEAQLKDITIKMLATNFSREILEKAKSGICSQFEVQPGMPALHLVKYFRQTGDLWQLDAAVHRMV